MYSCRRRIVLAYEVFEDVYAANGIGTTNLARELCELLARPFATLLASWPLSRASGFCNITMSFLPETIAVLDEGLWAGWYNNAAKELSLGSYIGIIT